MLSTNIIFSTLDRLDRFVIQYNMVMNPFENYKFDYSVDFVRTLTIEMLTTAIHIEFTTYRVHTLTKVMMCFNIGR